MVIIDAFTKIAHFEPITLKGSDTGKRLGAKKVIKFI